MQQVLLQKQVVARPIMSRNGMVTPGWRLAEVQTIPFEI